MFQDQIPIIISQAMVLVGGFVGNISMILPVQYGFNLITSIHHQLSPLNLTWRSSFFPKNLIAGFYCIMRFGGFGSLENYQTSWKTWKSQVLSQNVHHFEIQKSVSPHQRESPQKSSNLRQRWKFLVFGIEAQRIHPTYTASNESNKSSIRPTFKMNPSISLDIQTPAGKLVGPPKIYHPNTKPQEVWLDV